MQEEIDSTDAEYFSRTACTILERLSAGLPEKQAQEESLVPVFFDTSPECEAARHGLIAI